MPLGQHKIVITYLGNVTIGTVPLIFQYFIQQVGSSSTSSSIPSSTSSNTPTSNVPSGTTTTSSSCNSSSTGSSSTTNHRKPTEAIIGGVIGGLVLISLLLALFFFKRILNNRRPRALSEMSSIVPSPDVVNPFTSPPSNPNSSTAFLPQNFTSNCQSLRPRSILNKFSHQRGQLSDPANGASSGVPLTPSRPQFSSPAFTPSVSSPLRALPLTLSESQTSHDDSTRTRFPQAATESSMRRSPSRSPQGVNVRLLQHDDSGVRIPAEDEVQVVELPPVYSPE